MIDKYEQTHLKIAAKMLGGKNGWTGLLHNEFIEYLNNINSLVVSTNGSLLSRQTIAVAIQTWKLNNPNKKIYGD